MNTLKAIFSHSSDNVIIVDYSFNILWINRQEEIFSQYNGNCIELFKDQQLPLKSGKYCVNHGGMLYECNVINYPECKNGVYIIQTSNDDVIYTHAESKGCKEIITNHSSILRDSVMGISISNETLRKRLNSAGMYDDTKYVDIIHGNCCKLLKTATNMSELLHYSDNNYTRHKIDLSSTLKNFLEESQEILNDKIHIMSDIEQNLFISADENRLMVFLMSAIILANNGKRENNALTVSANRAGDFVSLTISPDSLGCDEANHKFSKHIDFYAGDEVNTDYLIVKRFCKIFSGTLYITESDENNRSFSFRLPYDNSAEKILELKSPKNIYGDNLFSLLRIMYSNIIY